MDFAKSSPLHRLAAVMAGQAYGVTEAGKKALAAGGYRLVKDTEEIKVYEPTAGAPTKQNPVVVAIRGTVPNLAKDIATDVALAAGRIRFTPRYRRNLKAVEKLQKAYNGHVLLTGHSLGGTLALFIGAELSLPAVAFNPGVGKNLLPRSSRRATIYRTPGDFVSLVGRVAMMAVPDFLRRFLGLPQVHTLQRPLAGPLSAHGIGVFGGAKSPFHRVKISGFDRVVAKMPIFAGCSIVKRN